MLGYSPEELIGASMHNLIHHSHEDGSHYPAERCPKNLTCRTGIASSSDTEVFWRKDGASFPVEYTANPLRWEGALAGAVVTFSDITERKRSRQQLNSQIARLAAMSAIDSYIMNSVDLTLTLDFIVGQIATPLNADAVDALVHRELEDCLECMAAVGFRYLNVRGRTQRAGEGQAGRTMLERKTIHYIDLQSHIGDFTHTDLLSRENLTSYISVPLIAKARVVGVLEVFHANAFEPDEEWMDLLRALAGQCAIAIESASLFESLQKTNLELRVAYDATIEGWSRALDMRDYETEGHSQRVAAITMRLAKAIGISGEDLVHIRRGALLHDIGKMAIPDRIFLSPLPFLRKALDIPYCHHERWDGTGYPNGLKGRQIPLAARLFAIADVWDALRSNRPYRKAWSVEKTRAYIQSNAGSHFDPELVDLFLRIGEE
jgi:PAS domain S-box-containing protein